MTHALVEFLSRVPAVRVISSSLDEARWWVKLAIDLDDPLAWRVVQELGHVINLLSVDERLPACFFPVSPPPYLNGGPERFLSWMIVNTSESFSSERLAEWLEGRLPRPVDDLREWALDP